MSELIESKYCVVCMENSTNINIGFTCRVCLEGIVCENCFDDCFYIFFKDDIDDEEPLVCPCCRSPDEWKDCCDMLVWILGLRQSQIYLYVNVGVIIICIGIVNLMKRNVRLLLRRVRILVMW